MQDLTYNTEIEKELFREWVIAVAEELTYNIGSDISYDTALDLLIGEDGELNPDEGGYPRYYGHPFEVESSGNDLIYHLYRQAFEPDEAGQPTTPGNYLRLYTSLYDEGHGVGDCAGILEAQKTLSTQDQETKLLPDRLLFHDNYVYIKDLACTSEEDLLELYKRIRATQINDPAANLSPESLHIARQANNAASEVDLAVILMGLAGDVVTTRLTRAEQDMYYHVLDALQAPDEKNSGK